MAVSYVNKQIVTDGLVLALDAGNHRSYPGSGTTWYDLSGNNKNITWDSTPSHTSGDAGYFSTSGKTATGPSSNSFGIDNSSGYTIIMVFQTNTFSSNSVFKFRSSSATDSSSRGIFLHPGWQNGTLYFDQGGCCNADQRLTYSSISTNTWYMIGLRSTVSTRSILLNGSGVVSNTTTTAANINLSSDTLLINPSDESYNWDGDLAIFAVYNRGISDLEFSYNFNILRGRFGI